MFYLFIPYDDSISRTVFRDIPRRNVKAGTVFCSDGTLGASDKFERLHEGVYKKERVLEAYLLWEVNYERKEEKRVESP